MCNAGSFRYGKEVNTLIGAGKKRRANRKRERSQKVSFRSVVTLARPRGMACRVIRGTTHRSIASNASRYRSTAINSRTSSCRISTLYLARRAKKKGKKKERKKGCDQLTRNARSSDAHNRRHPHPCPETERKEGHVCKKSREATHQPNMFQRDLFQIPNSALAAFPLLFPFSCSLVLLCTAPL